MELYFPYPAFLHGVVPRLNTKTTLPYRNNGKRFFETLMKEGFVGFEFLRAVATKSTVFWVVTPCSSEAMGRFVIRVEE
jgi:hypothetical protein